MASMETDSQLHEYKLSIALHSVVLNIHETLDYLLKIYNRPIKNNDHTCQKSIFCSLHLAKTSIIKNNLPQIKYYYFHVRVEANR